MSKSILEQKFKEKRINESSEDFKKQYKEKALETVIEEYKSKKNRYIFYCPDIVLVNPLTKIVYETAYAVKKAGFEVLILHEIEGYTAKWLYSNECYKHLRELKVDYVMKKKSSKSKKTRSNYSFKPSDTIVVPDQFQEILDNLIEVKTLNKIVLATSFTGIANLKPGEDYETLGVTKFLFTDKSLYEEYNRLFPNVSYSPISFPLSKEFHTTNRKKVYPLISISNIGNSDLTQQVVNIFYNRYPDLRIFNFRVLDRENLEIYKENFENAACILMLDKVLVSNQIFFEAAVSKTPMFSIHRPEIDSLIYEDVVIGKDAFEIAENLAKFCVYWLNKPSEEIDEEYSKLMLSKYNEVDFEKSISFTFKEIQTSRELFFNRISSKIKNG